MEQGNPAEVHMLHPDYDYTVGYFRKRGWNVIEGERSELVNAENVLQCGDGRYANVPSPLRKAGKAIFGALWGVAAMKTGGNEAGLMQAAALVRSKGIQPAVHGDEHGELSCGLFNVWKMKLLDGIRGIFQFALPENERAVKDTLTRMNVPIVTLPGRHEENELVISFVPRKTPKLDPHAFRLNGELANELGIPLQTYLEASAEAVRLLTKDRPQGPVQTVRIIG